MSSRANLPSQLDLPDTGERTADLAWIKSTAPLRPCAPQAACDHGLFSDQSNQFTLPIYPNKTA